MFQFFNKFKKDNSGKRAKDPVCGMDAGGVTFAYKDQVFSFCSDHCRTQFVKEPERYIVKQ